MIQDYLTGLSLQSSYGKLTLGTLVIVFVVLVSGILVAPSGSVVRCLGCPLYGVRLDLVDVRVGSQLARFLLSSIASIQVITVVVQAGREQHGAGGIRATATLLGLLFATEVVIGALILLPGSPLFLRVIHVATAAAFRVSLVVLVVLAGLASPAAISSKQALYE